MRTRIILLLLWIVALAAPAQAQTYNLSLAIEADLDNLASCSLTLNDLGVDFGTMNRDTETNRTRTPNATCGACAEFTLTGFNVTSLTLSAGGFDVPAQPFKYVPTIETVSVSAANQNFTRTFRVGGTVTISVNTPLGNHIVPTTLTATCVE